MSTFLLKRFLGLIFVLFAISIASFSLVYFVPGDVALVIAGPGASKKAIEDIRAELHLDKPFHVRYYLWLKSVFSGDLGRSAITKEPIAQMISFRIMNTIKLAGAGVAFAVFWGILMGLVAAIKRNSFLDYGTMALSIFGVSMPIFWIGLMLIYFFSLELGLFPVTGQGGIRHLVLPAITIGLNSIAIIARITRSSMLEVLSKDYIRTAKAKGCRRSVVVFKHALKNAMIPIITTIGLQFGYLLGGAVLTETVFAWPGIGRLFADSVFRRDFPVLQILMLMLAASFAVVNVLVDISYSLFDPRVKYK
jgi:ABC-type dipeptide/oligopeptide/nickel transport system permease component